MVLLVANARYQRPLSLEDHHHPLHPLHLENMGHHHPHPLHLEDMGDLGDLGDLGEHLGDREEHLGEHLGEHLEVEDLGDLLEVLGE